MATILEHSKILPTADYSRPELSLPLLFFDIVFYRTQLLRNVLFYEFPCSKSQFLNKIIPDLKTSLSLTLSQFLPFAGNIIHPLTPGDKPISHYKAGDSVSFTVSESNADLSLLIGNHPRYCNEFHAFVPNLPPATHSGNLITFPVLAVQATLFPGRGVCIGSITRHLVADGITILSFRKAWSLINRNMPNGEDYLRNGLEISTNSFSFLDRETVTEPNGLFSLFWEHIKKFSPTPEPPPQIFPLNMVRATFVLKKDEIQKLKKLVLMKCPHVAYLSSFTVICALVWVCWVKSAAPAADDEPEYFGFGADCRGRLTPPLPANYFGNCLAFVRAELKHGEFKGNDGFVMAAKAIGDATKKVVYNDEGVLCGAEDWVKRTYNTTVERRLRVVGSPKFDLYAADFGWGKPKKHEFLSIDGYDCVNLCSSRDFEGGVEIALSKPVVQMDAFTKIFTEVLGNLLELEKCTCIARI